MERGTVDVAVEVAGVVVAKLAVVGGAVVLGRRNEHVLFSIDRKGSNMRIRHCCILNTFLFAQSPSEDFSSRSEHGFI
uniref:Uncharacterized protein n=1 Tax=Romanomermis culicivorax TaxID=13658 RepID=A0A915JDP3_ROMCU